jgi:hypothetical protein
LIASSLCAACGVGVVGAAADDPPAAGHASDAGDAAPVVPVVPDAGDAAPEAAAPEPPRVFVHSETVLYRFDPQTGAETMIAAFAGNRCDTLAVGDIAFDRDGTLWAVLLPRDGGHGELTTIDPETAACAPSKGGMGRACNGLAAAPDPADATAELLYATCKDELFTVDRATGETKKVGGFGGALVSSGDVVHVDGVGLFATLTPAGAAGNDVLARLDAMNGKASIVVADVGAPNMWGLAWDGDRRLLAFGDATARAIDLAAGVPTALATTVRATGAATARRR